MRTARPLTVVPSCILRGGGSGWPLTLGEVVDLLPWGGRRWLTFDPGGGGWLWPGGGGLSLMILLTSGWHLVQVLDPGAGWSEPSGPTDVRVVDLVQVLDGGRWCTLSPSDSITLSPDHVTYPMMPLPCPVLVWTIWNERQTWENIYTWKSLRHETKM